ncbi:MAG: hemolysin family protein [Coprobacillus sp.]|nr:hemolysin family protein [Coprobacillus sp.]
MTSGGFVALYVCIVVVLLVVSFIFSVADLAYGSVSLTRLEKQMNEHPNSKRYKRAYKLTKDYDTTVSTILLGNDICNAGIDIFSTFLGVLVAMDFLNSTISADTWGLIFSLCALVFKILFGDVIAKSIGKIYNYGIVRSFSGFIMVFGYIMWPITYSVGALGKLVCLPIRNVNDNVTSDEDLEEMVDEAEQTGVVDEDKAEMLRGAIDYATTELYEVMTPRAKIYAIEKSKPLAEILKDERMFAHSRIPVYEETIDNIIGYVKMRDLIALQIQKKEKNIDSIIQWIPQFPKTSEINDILAYFNDNNVHIGVVLDEYGGTEGIVTREDILEEIVGEIWDETDDPEEEVVERADGTYIIDGGMNLEDFCDLLDIDYDKIETEYVTVGGFMIDLLDDKFPYWHDEAWIQGVKLHVLALGKNHVVKKLLVTPRPETIEEEKEKEETIKALKNGNGKKA